MSKRPKNRRQNAGPRSRAPRGAAFGVGSGDAIGHGSRAGAEPELHSDVIATLSDSDPLPLLSLASTMAASLERADPFTGRETELPTLAELVSMFRATGARATDALLLVLKEFTSNEVLARRISAEVAARGHRLPTWLTKLDRFRPTRAFVLGHILGDGESIVLGVDTPVGEINLVLYVDHNEGSVVKDGFPGDDSFDHITGRFIEMGRSEVGVTSSSLPLADARARLEQAVAGGRQIYPPFESDTWPAMRPLTEWMLRRLPSGGTGYPEPAEVDVSDLVEELASAAQRSGFDARAGSDDRDIAEMLMEFANRYFADPLRWSEVTAELVLVDLLPRKVHASRSFLARVPEVMREVVVFAHGVRGVPGVLTAEVLAAIDRHEPEFRRLTGATTSARDRRRDELMREFDTDDTDAYYKALLAGAVGGLDAIESLDTAPLTDHALTLDAVAADIHEKVTVVARIAGDAAEELFDPELRTVVLRLIERVAAADPAIFRRNSKVEMTAAALLWIAGSANEVFRRMTVTAMMAHLGLKGSPSQRAETMLRALGVEAVSGWSYDPSLGDPALLTSARRRDLAAHWEWVNGRAEHPTRGE